MSLSAPQDSAPSGKEKMVLHPLDADSHSFLVSESSKYVIEIMENLKLSIASNISVEDIEDEKDGAPSLSTVGKDLNKFTMEDLNNIRRERNRRHAKKTRFRKKIMLAQMELIITGLEEEVDKLRKDSNLVGVDLFDSAGFESNVTPHFPFMEFSVSRNMDGDEGDEEHADVDGDGDSEDDYQVSEKPAKKAPLIKLSVPPSTVSDALLLASSASTSDREPGTGHKKKPHTAKRRMEADEDGTNSERSDSDNDTHTREINSVQSKLDRDAPCSISRKRNKPRHTHTVLEKKLRDLSNNQVLQ